MKPSDKDIVSFQAIYKRRFGKDISKAEALEKGAKLLRLMELIYHPMKRNEFDAVEARRKKLMSDDASSSPTA